MAVTISADNYPAFTGATGVSGKSLVMYLNYGTGATEANPVWTLLGGCTNLSVSYSLEAASTQTKDDGYWAKSTITGKSGEVTAEVIMIRDNVAQEAIEEFVMDDDITEAKQALMVAIVDTDSLEYDTMKIVPTAWEITADAEDLVQKSLTATLTEAPVHATGFSAS